jgi:hypothetical protein
MTWHCEVQEKSLVGLTYIGFIDYDIWSIQHFYYMFYHYTSSTISLSVKKQKKNFHCSNKPRDPRMKKLSCPKAFSANGLRNLTDLVRSKIMYSSMIV